MRIPAPHGASDLVRTVISIEGCLCIVNPLDEVVCPCNGLVNGWQYGKIVFLGLILDVPAVAYNDFWRPWLSLAVRKKTLAYLPRLREIDL